MLSHIRLFSTPWTVAHLAPLSMGFSRQEYWNGLQCPPPGDLPNPGIKPASYVSCIDRQVVLSCHLAAYLGVSWTVRSDRESEFRDQISTKTVRSLMAMLFLNT